jgi:hypothetical protein
MKKYKELEQEIYEVLCQEISKQFPEVIDYKLKIKVIKSQNREL